MGNEKPLVYDTAYEALKRALGPKLDRAALERFRAIGVDFEKKLEPAYELTNAIEALRLASVLFAPGKPEAEAMEQLGRRITATFAEALVGKTLFATMRVLGTKRAISGLQRSLRMNNNYVQSKVTELGPNEVELWCGPVTFPTYYLGIFAQGLTATGAKEVAVELKGHDAQGATYRVKWS